MPLMTSTQAMTLWVDGVDRNSPGRQAVVVGWEVGWAWHPATTQRVIMGVRHVETGEVRLVEIGLKEVLNTFTLDEARAKLGALWEVKYPDVPKAVALAAAAVVVHALRGES